MQRTLYFGPAKGFYEPKKFNDFALIDIPLKLREVGSPSECNPERGSNKGPVQSASPSEGIKYHYPDAGTGLFYKLIDDRRCMVNLMSTRESIADEITQFIWDRDNEADSR